VPAPSDAEPAVPGVVDDLVRRATAREPAERFADAGEFLAAVRGALATMVTAVPGLEPREAAGVSFAEALTSTGLSAPLRAPEHTSVIPSTGVDDRAASRAPGPLRRPPGRKAAGPTGRRQPTPRSRWRGPILFALVMLLAVGTAVGAWWYGAGRYTVTPSLLNVTVAEAQASAEAKGLTAVQAGEQFSEVVPAGLVVETDPGPGERILHDGEIELFISKGPERYEVPDLAGKTREEAEQALAAASIPVGDVAEAYHDEVPAGIVASQSLAPGEMVRRDTPVDLTISLGREPVAIEDFTGRPFVDAERVLGEAGFDVVKQDVPNLTVPAGTVISQVPNTGTGFRGDQITLQVSWNPFSAQVQVPNVIGKKAEDAKRELESLGFKVAVRGEFDGSREVRDQTPKAGELRPSGSTVRLVLARG
jgi:eukaryotic-like serine/threonine-protein kinase